MFLQKTLDIAKIDENVSREISLKYKIKEVLNKEKYDKQY